MSQQQPYVIGIGGLKRSGKDTFARVITDVARERGFAVATIAFADPLRRAAAAAYGVDVSIFTDDARKDTFCEAWSTTYRQMLINLGEAMRGVDEDHWVKAWRQSVAGLIRPASHFFRPSFAGASQRLVLVPDLRRVNEAAAIHDAGGVTVLMRRSGVAWDGHVNEEMSHVAGTYDPAILSWHGCSYDAERRLCYGDPRWFAGSVKARPIFDNVVDNPVAVGAQATEADTAKLRNCAIALVNTLLPMWPMSYSARIVCDSIAPHGVRLVTVEATYPRFVHSELMTHRTFCLAGDSVLEFELPAGQKGNRRRVYKLPLADFVDKWLNGSKPHLNRWGSIRTYDLKSRLMQMRIRQLDEATGDITTSTVLDASVSGSKPVYEVIAGKYHIAGSADHRVLTVSGWKRIADISPGDDQVIVSTRQKPLDLRTDAKRLKKIAGQWRSVFQREQRERLISASPTCRQCPNVGADIHHIIPVHLEPTKAFDVNNITLLCLPCHKAAHSSQGWQTGVPLYSGTVTVETVRYRGVEPTYDLTIAGAFPNFLANQVVVHNSRNSSSSRAIPIAKMIQRVIDDPVMPVSWGQNQRGMQAGAELSGDELAAAQTAWLRGRDAAVETARTLAAAGLHKQVVNRVLEPWMWITALITATEWDNFFAQRCHPDAQPEIRAAAELIRDAMAASTPVLRRASDWHLPYVTDEERSQLDLAQTRQLSVARCARVSYLTHDGLHDIAADLDLYQRLRTAKPPHWSPFEHVAEAAPTRDFIGNFRGWHPYRKTFAGESGAAV